ncbi:MAG: T9SS C-terminal target domain-containing protein, partial [Bacteroidota bacterium]
MKTLLAFGISLSLTVVSAKENVGLTGGRTGASGATSSACTPATGKVDININNVRALIMNGGDMWWDQGLEVPRYEVPKGSGKHSYFAAALWIGGLDQGGQLRTAAQTYRQSGNDFWPGPLDITNASIDATGCSKWDKLFQIYRQDVADYVAYLSSPSDFPGYSIPASITSYPGNGDVSLNEDISMAPFWDVNGDGLYRPDDGDYPKYDIFNTASSGGGCANFLFGDQTLWWVFNDKGNIHSETGGQPLGLEIRAQAFAFATNDEINDMTFYQYQVINRGNITISNTYFGSWNDPDLGLYTDDFVGCDVKNGLGFCYNSDDQDGTGSGNSYGDKPPCSAVDFFKGPKADPYLVNGVEVDRPASQTISGSGYGDGIVGNETLGMEYFMIFQNDPSVRGNPSQATHFYNYLQSKWKDGTSLTYGGSGYGGTVPCKFGFPWTSDDSNGNVDWQCSDAQDWRFIHSAGPFTLKPGAVNYVTTGCVWAQAQTGGAKASVELVRLADVKAQALFDNCFAVLEGPRAPDLTIQELNNQLILYITNPDVSTFNNRNEKYQELDPLIPALPGYDRTYNFEGYLIYQVKDGTVTASEGDLNDPTKARLVAQCDVKNEHSQLVNYRFNSSLNANEPMLKNPTIKGYNQGIRHSFKVTEDKFASGTDKKLVNHKTYYFLAIAYGANNFKTYNQTDPTAIDGQKKPFISGAKSSKGQSVAPVAGIPHITSPENGGTTLQSGYGDGPKIKRVEGQGSGYQNLDLTDETIAEILANNKVDQPVYKNSAGPIDVKVIDPLNVPDSEFQLKFVSHVLVPKISLQGGTIDSLTAIRLNRNTPPFNTEYVYANVPLNSTVYAIQGLINDSTYRIRKVKDILTAVDTAAWVLTNLSTRDSVSSDTCINVENEKLILDWGLSVRITKAVAPSVDMVENQNGFITSSFEFDDPTKTWLFGMPDQDGQSAFNWIRAGTTTNPNPLPGPPSFSGNDFIGVDDNQFFEGIFGGTWAPYILGSNEWNGVAWNTLFFNPVGRKREIMRNLRSIDLVITSDKSKWTRCAVLEMQDDVNLAQGGAAKFDLRKSASVDKDGKDDGSGTIGMGWFPGYAINVETGERLNMAFGEDSWLVGDNGRDMIWNPTSSFTDNFTNGY